MAQQDPYAQIAKPLDDPYASMATAQTAPEDTRNSIQKSFDENTADNPNDPFIKSLLKSAVRTPLQPLMHPLKALSYVPVTAGLPSAQPSVEPQGSIGHRIANTVGGTIGMAGLMGGTKAAEESLPSSSRAGQRFEMLNTKLANEPVNLTETAQPLQRATEIGVRGGTLPTPVKALLERSQSPIAMTYPEARDYQSSLAAPSVMDRLSTSPRMAGATKQINKAMFGDIKNAADAQGLGEDYQKAVDEYRQAKVLGNLAKSAAIGGGAAAAAKLGAGPILRSVKNLVVP